MKTYIFSNGDELKEGDLVECYNIKSGKIIRKYKDGLEEKYVSIRLLDKVPKKIAV